MSIHVDNVLERIHSVLSRENRKVDEVTVVAVTKGVRPELILQASDSGLKHFGENRVQEAMSKIRLLPNDLTWHMVGHLQRNKAKTALNIFDLIQSLDSKRLALEISKHASSIGKVARVLIQVNTTSERSKFGVMPERLAELLDNVDRLESIQVVGLMTIGPFTDDASLIRRSFRTLKKLFDDISEKSYRNVKMNYLSMGMTDDFEIALEEGANMLRIGRAFFGPRTS